MKTTLLATKIFRKPGSDRKMMMKTWPRQKNDDEHPACDQDFSKTWQRQKNDEENPACDQDFLKTWQRQKNDD